MQRERSSWEKLLYNEREKKQATTINAFALGIQLCLKDTLMVIKPFRMKYLEIALKTQPL
jgi:hypothetical protein